ncbi:MAG TPA: tetratricopeptide repeat protein [Saprospiraceae bacterium]|nr:tetratricopeptide repeat protein [Saprospiraceae bacterium]
MKLYPEKVKKDIFILILIILATFLTYSNHFHNAFHFDDSHTIQENIHIRSLSNIPQFFYKPEMFSASPAHWGLRPLVTTTLALDYHWSGNLDPFYFHVSNFSYHILIILLLFVLYKHFFTKSFPQRTWIPSTYLFATSVYALHTVNAETINYIISRSDLLSTLCIVASFSFYVYRPLWRKYYLYILPALLGVMAKETVSTLPILLFFYVLLFEKNMDLRRFFSRENLKISFGVFISLLPLTLSIAALQIYTLSMAADLSSGVSNPFLPYWHTQAFVWLHYFFAYFFPFNLSADTDLTIISNSFDIRVLSGACFILFMIWVIIKTSSQKVWRPVAFGLIWFMVALLPTSLAPLAEVMNDHRMYYPFIGLNFAVVYSVMMLIAGNEDKISGRRWVKPIVYALMLMIPLAYAFGAHQRNKVWKDAESLWYDVTVKSPKNGRGLMNYGLTLMGKGRYPEALDYYTRAMQYTPYYPHLHINMGILHSAMGNPAKAEESFQNARRYGSKSHLPDYYYGRYLYGQDRKIEARDHVEDALKKNPYHLPSRHLLMALYSESGHTELLNAMVEETMQLLPQDEVALRYKTGMTQSTGSEIKITEVDGSGFSAQNWLNKSLEYYRQERYEDCIKACLEALKLQPRYAEAFNNICSAYNAMGKWYLAIEACEQAVRIKPDFQLAINNMNYAKRQLME